MVPLHADQGEVRCNSVATIITVIDAHLCAEVISRDTHQATSEGYAHFARTFLDMKSVAVFVNRWVYCDHFDEIATLFTIFR